MPVANVFKTMVLSLAAMVLVLLGVGQILADHWQVETARSFDGKPERIAAIVTDLGTWKQWAATDIQLGSPTHHKLVGEPATVGHQLVWDGPRGHATVTLQAVRTDGVDFAWRFTEAGSTTERVGSTGTIEWRADGGGCRVVWRERGEHAGTIGRWFGWFGALQEKVQQIQRAGLEGLAQRLRDDPAAAGGDQTGR